MKEFDPEEMEKLERDWLRASMTAENKCVRKADAPFAAAIAKLRRSPSSISMSKLLLSDIVDIKVNKGSWLLAICRLFNIKHQC